MKFSTARLLRRLLPLSCALALAGTLGCDEVPTILPPPFGPRAGTPPRLFFPTGIAIAPSGQVLIANGNFDHAYAAGTVVSLDPTYLQSFFDQPVTDPNAVPDPIDIPPSAFLGAVMVGNYTGPLTIDQTGVRAFTGSRDTSTLNAVQLDPVSGSLSCINGSSATDCRNGFVNTGDVWNLLGPYAIVPGVSRLPGAASDTPVLFVSPLIPHVDTSIDDLLYTSATLVALKEGPDSDPANALWAGEISNYLTGGGGIGGGSMIFDPLRRRLVLAGCYTRFTGQQVGDPSTGKCTVTTTPPKNLIRFIGVDEGANPDVQVIDIGGQVQSVDTEDIALGNDDPVTGLAQTLYAITRSPDTIAEIGLPTDPTAQVLVTRATSLPIAPAQMLRLQRPPGQSGPDLIAVTLESSQSLAIYDASVGNVVGVIENLGYAPVALAQFPPQPGDTTARLAIDVFQDCRVALVDVNFAQPWQIRLRARLGSCPIVAP